MTARDELAAAVEALLRDQGARQHGDELRFLCPSAGHGETNPSCDYNVVKAVAYCHGCRTTWNVHQLAPMLGIQTLKPIAPKKGKARKSAAKKFFREIPTRMRDKRLVAAWDYHDANGNVVEPSDHQYPSVTRLAIGVGGPSMSETSARVRRQRQPASADQRNFSSGEQPADRHGSPRGGARRGQPAIPPTSRPS